LAINGESISKDSDYYWTTTKYIGILTSWGGQTAFRRHGVLRDYNGILIGERPIEMQMLGPLDYMSAGQLKAGLAIGVIAIGGLKVSAIAAA
jgi:hypothetical protein